MSVTIVAGAQWGDEGKGRIVDLLAQEADLVVRCQGGPNAGHTVINDLGKFVLHAIPSGIFSERARCIIGTGTVVNPVKLVREMEGLIDAGIDVGRLLISERAHIIMPYHILIENLDEAHRSTERRIAPTGQGIANAYADKASRCGLRAEDLVDMDRLKCRLAEELTKKNQVLSFYDHPPIKLKDILEKIEPAAKFLKPYVGDTVIPISGALRDNRQILLEGQLGVMRDLDWGAYPFVTSSSPTPAGMVAGAGIPPQSVDRVIGVVKAYTSAVGTGPFPTELVDEEGSELRDTGKEYGATTGRPRRCGWFDAVATSWACRLAGFTEIALTKVDVLDGMPSLPMCVAYQDGSRMLESFPTTSAMERVRAVYEQFPGWISSTCGARSMDELPGEARDYIMQIENRVGIPISLVSVGPERESVIRV